MVDGVKDAALTHHRPVDALVWVVDAGLGPHRARVCEGLVAGRTDALSHAARDAANLEAQTSDVLARTWHKMAKKIFAFHSI